MHKTRFVIKTFSCHVYHQNSMNIVSRSLSIYSANGFLVTHIHSSFTRDKSKFTGSARKFPLGLWKRKKKKVHSYEVVNSFFCVTGNTGNKSTFTRCAH